MQLYYVALSYHVKCHFELVHQPLPINWRSDQVEEDERGVRVFRGLRALHSLCAQNGDTSFMGGCVWFELNPIVGLIIINTNYSGRFPRYFTQIAWHLDVRLATIYTRVGSDKASLGKVGTMSFIFAESWFLNLTEIARYHVYYIYLHVLHINKLSKMNCKLFTVYISYVLFKILFKEHHVSIFNSHLLVTL